MDYRMVTKIHDARYVEQRIEDAVGMLRYLRSGDVVHIRPFPDETINYLMDIIYRAAVTLPQKHFQLSAYDRYARVECFS